MTYLKNCGAKRREQFLFVWFVDSFRVFSPFREFRG
jgi:hypothetical protein